MKMLSENLAMVGYTWGENTDLVVENRKLTESGRESQEKHNSRAGSMIQGRGNKKTELVGAGTFRKISSGRNGTTLAGSEGEIRKSDDDQMSYTCAQVADKANGDTLVSCHSTCSRINTDIAASSRRLSAVYCEGGIWLWAGEGPYYFQSKTVL